jgi:hypothetical protein
MGATGVSTAFHATGRFARQVAQRAPRTAKVLMDPGADVNIIRTSIVTGTTKSRVEREEGQSAKGMGVAQKQTK